MVIKPFVLSFLSLFSTVTMHKTKAFLHMLDIEPKKTFGFGQSSIMSESRAKDCVALRPYPTSMFDL